MVPSRAGDVLMAEEAVCLFEGTSVVTSCCRRSSLDERVVLGTYDRDKATCSSLNDEEES